MLSTENIRLVGSKELKRTVKFAARYIGPFRVEAVVNANAYKLELPATFQMHPTVNITRLKRMWMEQQQFPSREVEMWQPDGRWCWTTMGRRSGRWRGCWRSGERERGRQYLVKWKGWPLWEATWERESNLENAQEKLNEFRKQVEENEAIRVNSLDMGHFREVENVTESESTGLQSRERGLEPVTNGVGSVNESGGCEPVTDGAVGCSVL